MKKFIKELNYSLNFKIIGLKIKYTRLSKKYKRDIDYYKKINNDLTKTLDETLYNFEYVSDELEKYKELLKVKFKEYDNKKGKKLKKKQDKEVLK